MSINQGPLIMFYPPGAARDLSTSKRSLFIHRPWPFHCDSSRCLNTGGSRPSIVIVACAVLPQVMNSHCVCVELLLNRHQE